MLTKKHYFQRTAELTKNFPDSKNWQTAENRWPYHAQAIKWLKQLKPKSVLEIGSLGVKLREDSKTLDNGSWKVEYELDYKQDVRELNIPRFDCIVALRVLHHYPDDFLRIFSDLRAKCECLILALPKEMEVPEPSEQATFNDTTIYLWK
jgi:hypothetical protein